MGKVSGILSPLQAGMAALPTLQQQTKQLMRQNAVVHERTT